MTTMTMDMRERPGVGELEAELEAIGARTDAAAMRQAAMMEHLAALAADSESEAEAEAFIGALVPMAASLIPKIAPRVAAAVPALTRGASRLAGQLWRQPATRQMVRAVPTMVRRSMADLARRHAAGRPIRGVDVTRTLARHSVPVLQAPDQRRRIITVNRAVRRSWPVPQIAVPPRRVTYNTYTSGYGAPPSQPVPYDTYTFGYGQPPSQPGWYSPYGGPYRRRRRCRCCGR